MKLRERKSTQQAKQQANKNVKTKSSSKRKVKINIIQEKEENELNPIKKQQKKQQKQQEQENENKIAKEDQQNKIQQEEVEKTNEQQNQITQETQIQIKTSNFVQKQLGSYSEKYNEIEEKNKLGEGNEGSVYKVYEKNSNENRCKAMKIIKKNKLITLYKNQFIREIELLKNLDHPNILKIYEFYEDEDNFYLIEEFMNGKDLFDEIMDKDTFSEQEAASIIKQILSALILTHKSNLVHRDIKPDNIFVLNSSNEEIEQETNNSFDIKIIDFGICDKMEQNQKLELKVGTLEYCAPEIIRGQQYDEKCDIWSTGCILYTILAMEHPFMHFGQNQQKTMENITSGNINLDNAQFSIISEEAKDLLQQMLKQDPKERISAEEAFQHKWIQDLQKINNEGKDSQQTKKQQLNLEKLKSFSCQSKLHQACISFIASHLITDKEKNQLKQTFYMLDKNGDGQLSRQEILDGLTDIYGKEEAEKQVEQIFKSVDVDNSGFLDYNEFIMATMDKKDKFTKRKMSTVFKLFDKDGDGQITVDELKQVFFSHLEDLEGVDEKIFENVIKEVDEDFDGQISFEEFEKFMLKMAGPEKEIVRETLSQ